MGQRSTGSPLTVSVPMLTITNSESRRRDVMASIGAEKTCAADQRSRRRNHLSGIPASPSCPLHKFR